MNVVNKKQIEDLAILGGEPAFSETLHVGRPNIGDRDRFLQRVNDMLDRRWLTNNGPFVQEFEQKIAEMIGVEHCIAICNATVGLEIAIRALRLKGEVIVPSFTFIATAHALQWQEITPVFCDIDPATHNIDPAKIERMITPKTSGILGVHVWGRACDISSLDKIAQKHHLRLLFDAAHAFGCSYQGQMIGNFGDAEVFSFHATKFLNSFEGGAIVTNDPELAQKIRWMTNFGFGGYDRVLYLGTNGKMTEVCAAMGITGLEGIDNLIATNFRNYQTYQQELADVPGIRMISYDESEKNNFQYIILELDPEVTGISRDTIVKLLHAENVLARRYFYPGCHEMEPYHSLFPHAGLLLPETEKLVQRVMSLPSGTAVTPDDIKRICEILCYAIKNGESITQSLYQKT
jgi:dTDP-4-amino-4,6-dideoxygalactose transaminase